MLKVASWQRASPSYLESLVNEGVLDKIRLKSLLTHRVPNLPNFCSEVVLRGAAKKFIFFNEKLEKVHIAQHCKCVLLK